jgi:hypothetical protein
VVDGQEEDGNDTHTHTRKHIIYIYIIHMYDVGLRGTYLLKFTFCMCGILNRAISCLEPTIQCRVAE